MSASRTLARHSRDHCRHRLGFADANLERQAALRLSSPDVPGIGVLGTSLAFQDPPGAPATDDLAEERQPIEQEIRPFSSPQMFLNSIAAKSMRPSSASATEFLTIAVASSVLCGLLVMIAWQCEPASSNENRKDSALPASSSSRVRYPSAAGYFSG